jgi:hypothetical protein
MILGHVLLSDKIRKRWLPRLPTEMQFYTNIFQTV